MVTKNNLWQETLYPLFLTTLSSCTLTQYTDAELEHELGNFARRAIARFMFPRISLQYTQDEANNYMFVHDVTDKELEFIVAYMNVLWLEYQLQKERHYENVYVDKDVKAFSSGSLITAITKALESHNLRARKIEEHYYRSENGQSTLEDLNGG